MPAALDNFAAALKFVAPLVAPQAGYCHWATDYDCRCSQCSALTRAHWYVSAFVWSVANAAMRQKVNDALGGLRGLALVGAAVRAALAPGAAFSQFVRDAGHVWDSADGNLKGCYFRVAGKRGKAKAHHGKVGVVKWVGESDYIAGRGPWALRSSTVRLGLAIEGEAKLIYVAHGQCERLPIPADVAREREESKVVRTAIATLRPKWAGEVPAKKKRESTAKWKARCPVAYVVSGRDAGKSGRVFWVGTDKKTGEAGARLGIECQLPDADGSAATVPHTLWISAYDCADRPMVPVATEEKEMIERVAADAALEGDETAARELLAQLRREAQ